jgi:hypothetical protein
MEPDQEISSRKKRHCGDALALPFTPKYSVSFVILDKRTLSVIKRFLFY